MRPLKAIISLKNLKSNYLYLKQLHKNKLLAVVKADAYGHGLENCSKYIDDIADGFAVAFLEEAIMLRELGIKNNILLLEGVFNEQEYSLVAKYKLWTVIQNNDQLSWFCNYDWKDQLQVWIKLDIGMHRLGFDTQEFINAYNILNKLKFVNEIVKMSHFCCADCDDENITNLQIDNFNKACSNLKGEESLANSAAILRFPNSYKDWGRAGISLYGISPFCSSKFNINNKLKPVMSFKSHIFSVKNILKGQSIGYRQVFTATYDMKIGVVACGYADGYPRFSNKNDNPCLIDGIKSRIIGIVSMDMLAVEINNESQGIGSEVELWGEYICVNEIASNSNTISYELLCHVKRAYKEYLY